MFSVLKMGLNSAAEKDERKQWVGGPNKVSRNEKVGLLSLGKCISVTFLGQMGDHLATLWIV